MWQKTWWNRIVTFIYTEEGEVIGKNTRKSFLKGICVDIG